MHNLINLNLTLKQRYQLALAKHLGIPVTRTYTTTNDNTTTFLWVGDVFNLLHKYSEDLHTVEQSIRAAVMQRYIERDCTNLNHLFIYSNTMYKGTDTISIHRTEVEGAGLAAYVNYARFIKSALPFVVWETIDFAITDDQRGGNLKLSFKESLRTNLTLALTKYQDNPNYIDIDAIYKVIVELTSKSIKDHNLSPEAKLFERAWKLDSRVKTDNPTLPIKIEGGTYIVEQDQNSTLAEPYHCVSMLESTGYVQTYRIKQIRP